MPTVVGIFERRAGAERAASELAEIGIPKEQISILTPNLSAEELTTVSATQGEQPGIVKRISAVTGGAVGLGTAALLVPGVGSVLAIGLAGGALLGALAGRAIGGALEEFVFPGIPEQELFLYEDALRKGRTGVIAVAKSETQANAARGIFEYAGAESIDRARQMWWLGIRDIEKEKYAAVGDFGSDEPYVRQGFEAALDPRSRNKSYEEYSKMAGDRDLDALARDAFRHGYERGRAYLQARQQVAVHELR
jgi:hypothetical protein